MMQKVPQAVPIFCSMKKRPGGTLSVPAAAWVSSCFFWRATEAAVMG